MSHIVSYNGICVCVNQTQEIELLITLCRSYLNNMVQMSLFFPFSRLNLYQQKNLMDQRKAQRERAPFSDMVKQIQLSDRSLLSEGKELRLILIVDYQINSLWFNWAQTLSNCGKIYCTEHRGRREIGQRKKWLKRGYKGK